MFDFIRRSMMARLAALVRLAALGAVAILTSGAQSSCSVGDPSQIPQPTDRSGDGPTFTTTLVLRDAAGTAKNTFQAGELITFELSVRNRTAQPVELDFRSGQQYDFFAFDSGTTNLVWLWSSAALFTQAESALTFAAGETKVFTVTWAQGNRGSYEARGAVLFDGLETNRQASHELGSTLVPFTIN
jgi:hypothetical protein